MDSHAVFTQIADQYRESHKSSLVLGGVGTIYTPDAEMRVYIEAVGSMPMSGWPVYICLHGGGQSDTPTMNDSQWQMMRYYYKAGVENALIVAPRGIEDTWNTHFTDRSYALYDELIAQLYLSFGCDLNRIYLLGYSAGGDGVYGISARMADRFAAFNMSAGHPNGVDLTNLYNTPIILQAGENDLAFNRNRETARYGEVLRKLGEKGGYVHRVFIHKDRGHNFRDNSNENQTVYANPTGWLNGVDGSAYVTDTNAPRLLSRFIRNPLPARVVFNPSVTAPRRAVKSFYWVRCEGEGGGIVDVSYNRAENAIQIDSAPSSCKLTILLNRDMLNLDEQIIVRFKEKSRSVKAVESEQIATETASERLDPSLVFTAAIEADCL